MALGLGSRSCPVRPGREPPQAGSEGVGTNRHVLADIGMVGVPPSEAAIIVIAAGHPEQTYRAGSARTVPQGISDRRRPSGLAVHRRADISVSSSGISAHMDRAAHSAHRSMLEQSPEPSHDRSRRGASSRDQARSGLMAKRWAINPVATPILLPPGQCVPEPCNLGLQLDHPTARSCLSAAMPASLCGGWLRDHASPR